MEYFDETPEEPPSTNRISRCYSHICRLVWSWSRLHVGAVNAEFDREIPEVLSRGSRHHNYGFSYRILPPLV